MILENQLSQRGVDAVVARTEQVEVFVMFVKALDKALVKKWTKMALAGEEDMEKSKPYMPSKTGTFFIPMLRLLALISSSSSHSGGCTASTGPGREEECSFCNDSFSEISV